MKKDEMFDDSFSTESNSSNVTNINEALGRSLGMEAVETCEESLSYEKKSSTYCLQENK